MKNRYLVVEHYLGAVYDVNVIAATDSIFDADRICHAMMMYRQAEGYGKVFDYKFKKIADDYFDYLDDLDYFVNLWEKQQQHINNNNN